MKVTVIAQPLESVTAQALVVLHESTGVLAASKNKELAGHIDTFVRDVKAGTCRREWFCTLPHDGTLHTHHLLLDSVSFTGSAPGDEALKMTAARCIALCREYSLGRIAIAVQHKDAVAKAAAILEGIVLGDFHDKRYKSGASASDKKRPSLQLIFVVPKGQEKAVKAALDRVQIISHAQNWARELVNTPHHDLTPAEMVNAARAMARRRKLRISVLDEKQLKARGYLPTWEVGRGSEYPPRMIILHYAPSGTRLRVKEHLCLVGKGMTFDSGGLCIKPGDSMHRMNGDMGGAAAVLGAMDALAALKYPGRITAIIGSAHNAIDGAAYYPGCIIKAKNGKTIYVENTDAEGRLVLSDCFARAGEEKVDIIWDFATLTGAAGMALGPSIAALFTDDSELQSVITEAGTRTGDHVWQLPLVREYEAQLNHPLADMKNIAGEKGGGAIHAANFLRQFIPEGTRWAHVDIASVATTDKPRRYYRTGATGFGVRLAVEAVTMLAEKAK